MICEAALCDDFDLVEAAILRELERICKGAGDGIRRMAVTVDHDLTAAGAELISDSCPDQPCWHYLKGMVGITESPKCAYYPRRRGINFVIRDLDTCIEAALTGEVK
mgnify:CR=1 FL=1